MPKKNTRSPRSDSATAAIEAAKAAVTPLPKPPSFVRLRPQDKPFWESIMASRAREEWAEADLVVAAQLARLQADIEKYQLQAEQEGPVIENARGTPVSNPVFSALEQMSRRQLAMLRTLTIGGSIAGASKAKMAERRRMERTARQAHDEVEEDEDLLA